MRQTLSLFGVSAAPAFGGHLLAGEQGARTGGSTGRTLVQGARGAALTGGKLGEFRLVGLGGIWHIAQRFGLRISFGDHGGICSHGGAGYQGSAAQAELNNEFATVGHEIFPEFVKKDGQAARVGQFAAVVRAMKKPEPYLGKGIRYSDEVIRRKQGKKAA